MGVPMALAENSGLSPIAELTAVKAAQVAQDCPFFGSGLPPAGHERHEAPEGLRDADRQAAAGPARDAGRQDDSEDRRRDHVRGLRLGFWSSRPRVSGCSLVK